MKCGPIQLTLFALVSLAAAALGHALAFPQLHGASIAFVSGIYLAVLLLADQRAWMRWTAAALIVHVVAAVGFEPDSMPWALVDVVAHVAGAWIAAFLVRRVCGTPFRYDSPRNVFALAAFSAVPGAAISATVEVMIAATGASGAGTAGITWIVYFTGYSLGGSIIAPLVLTAFQNEYPWRRISVLRRMEAIVLAVTLIAVLHAVFSSAYPLIYLALLPMLWVALRFDMLGMALAMTLFAVMALHYTAMGLGPYAATGATPVESALLTQSFLSIAAIAAFLLASVTAQRRTMLAELQHVRDALETRVRERTAALRENDERFTLARAAAKIIVIDWDIQRDVLTFSDSPEWLRGPLPASGKYPLFKEQVHPDDRAHFLAMRQRSVNTLEGSTVEFRMVRTDGAVLHIQSYQTMIPGPDGKAAQLLAIHQDITARKHVEIELAKNQQRLTLSEARYRNLYVSNPLMYFTIDAAGTIASVNPQGAVQLGYRVDELVGRSVIVVFPADLHDQVHAQLNLCLGEPGRVHTWETTKVRKDGVLVSVRETATAVQSEDQTPLLLIMCEDITERRQAETRRASR